MAKGSLTFPSDPLASMRDLSDLDAPSVDTDSRKPAHADSRKPVDTEVRRDVDTDARKYASTEARTDASTDLREQGSKGASERVSTDVSKPASTQGRADGRASVPKEARKPASKAAVAEKNAAVVEQTDGADTLMAAVEAALESREPLEGGVKATVDMSPELSSRAKRYLADHRGRSTRQVLVALLDAYLAGKGY